MTTTELAENVTRALVSDLNNCLPNIIKLDESSIKEDSNKKKEEVMKFIKAQASLNNPEITKILIESFPVWKAYIEKLIYPQ